MMEGPIKLFSSLEERFPEASDIDVAHASVRTVISAVPILGSPINEVLAVVLLPPIERRKDDWLKTVAGVVDELQTKIEGLGPETLANNEQFISALIEASRIAISTHQDDKRLFLRNILVNVGSVCKVPEDVQFMYLRLVDDFTPTHVRLLECLWRMNEWLTKKKGLGTLPTGRRYSEILEEFFPEFHGIARLADYVLTDLRSRGLCTLQSIAHVYPQQVVTNQGIDFLNFVLSPEELSQ